MINIRQSKLYSWLRQNHIEILVCGACTVLLFLFFAFLSPGGPLSTDVLGYANNGLNNVASPKILNRYMHIYLQKLFLETAPNPLTGLQMYWAFLLTATCLCIYIFSRNLTRRSHFLNGVIAIGLFLSFNELGDAAGITHVDVSAMFMSMLTVMIYLLSANQDHKSRTLLLLFGMLLFLALKTKETVIGVYVLTIGIGFLDDRFLIKVFLRNLSYVAGGFLGGIFIFSIWSWIVLNDPFFGLKSSDILSFYHSYIQGGMGLVPNENLNSWYSYIFYSPLFVQILLFVISCIRIAPELKIPKRIIFIQPLILLLFLALTVNNTFGYTPRFLLPAIPVICAVASQFMVFGLWEGKKEKLELAGTLIFTIMAIALVGGGYFYFVRSRWGLGSYIYTIYYPLILTSLLTIVFLKKQITSRFAIGTAALVLALIGPPLLRNFKVMAIEKTNWHTTQAMIYPFSSFKNEITINQNTRMYVTSDVWDVVGASMMSDMLTEDQNATSNLYNLINPGSRAVNTNFIDSAKPNLDDQELLARDEDYIMLTLANWDVLDLATQHALEIRYQVFRDSSNLLLLLRRW